MKPNIQFTFAVNKPSHKTMKISEATADDVDMRRQFSRYLVKYMIEPELEGKFLAVNKRNWKSEGWKPLVCGGC